MLDYLKNFAREPGDSEELAFRKLLIFLIASICCICGLAWSTLYYFIFGFGVIASLPLLFVLLVGSAIIASHYLRNYKILVYAQLTCIMWVTAFIQWTIGGIDSSGFVTAWSFLGPLGAVIFLSLRESILWMLMFLLVLIVSAVFEPALLGYKPEVTPAVKILFYIMNIGVASSVVFAASAWFVKSIQDEKKRSDNLLLNILPVEVADELKEKGYSDARYFDNVTVLFTDFKSFTTVSEKLKPQQLVDELNTCFSAFDEIIGKYNIEKIKTVGDAYLAVSGLPLANPNHAEDMVQAAIEIRDFMYKRKQETHQSGLETFEIRIGIHSGSVVAGIVGLKKFAYDIWGDTVNTAARMEQNGEAGKVNISEATYQLLTRNSTLSGYKYSFEYRGEIEAKNKGKLKMYFVS